MEFLDYIQLDNIEGVEAPEEMARRVYPEGTKFNICSDNDPWYIVGYVDDSVKFKGTFAPLVVYKSWTKYKQRWVYKVEDSRLFLMEQDFLIKMNDPKKIIPLKKDKEYKKIISL